MRNRWLVGGALGAAVLTMYAVAHAQADSPGRYTMSPAEGGGFARLDTETGQMSLCQRRDGEWSCRDMGDPDRGLSQEIERLRTDNLRLKAEIKQMEEMLLGDKRSETDPRSSGRGPQFKLPSEQDIDSAMDYVQRMLRKFRERLKDFEHDGKGVPL